MYLLPNVMFCSLKACTFYIQVVLWNLAFTSRRYGRYYEQGKKIDYIYQVHPWPLRSVHVLLLAPGSPGREQPPLTPTFLSIFPSHNRIHQSWCLRAWLRVCSGKDFRLLWSRFGIMGSICMWHLENSRELCVWVGGNAEYKGEYSWNVYHA